MLTDKQIKFYRKNSYLIVQDIFTNKESIMFNQFIRRHANKDFAAIVNPDRYEQLAEQDERPKSDVRLEEIKETVAQSIQILKNPKIVSILETLQEKEVVGLSTQFIFKEAHSAYSSQAWKPHQDSMYPGDKNGQYITSNWFLRGADVENGKIPKEYFDKKVDVIIPKNSVLFLHGHCIHGSYSNNSDRSRPWFSCCYISKGEKYHVGTNAQRKEIELR